MSSDLVAILSHLLQPQARAGPPASEGLSGGPPLQHDPSIALKILTLMERSVRDQAATPQLEAAVTQTFRTELEALTSRHNREEAEMRAAHKVALDSMTAARDATQAECNRLTADLAAVRKELASVISAKAEVDSLNASMSRIVEKVSAANEATVVRLNEATESNRQKDITVAQLQSTVKTLEVEVARLGAEVLNQSTQRSATTARLDATIQALQKELTSARVCHETDLRELADIRVKLQYVSDVALVDARSMVSMEEASARARLESTISQDALDLLGGSLSSMASAASVHHTTAGLLQGALSRESIINDQLREEVARGKVQQTESLQVIALLQGQLAEATELSGKLRAAVNDASRALDNEIETNRRATGTISALREEIAVLSKLQEVAVAREATLAESQAQVVSLKTELRVSQAEALEAHAAEMNHHRAYTEAAEQAKSLWHSLQTERGRAAQAEQTVEELRSLTTASVAERKVFEARYEEMRRTLEEATAQYHADHTLLEQQRSQWAAEQRRLLGQTSEAVQDLADCKAALHAAQEKTLLSPVVSFEDPMQSSLLDTQRSLTEAKQARCKELEAHVRMLTESFQGLEEIVGAVVETTLRKAKTVLALPGVVLRSDDGLETKLQVLNTVIDVAVGTLSGTKLSDKSPPKKHMATVAGTVGSPVLSMKSNTPKSMPSVPRTK